MRSVRTFAQSSDTQTAAPYLNCEKLNNVCVAVPFDFSPERRDVVREAVISAIPSLRAEDVRSSSYRFLSFTRRSP